MNFAQKIREKLITSLKADVVEVVDESHLHRGHAGARPGGESHFRVRIVSAMFDGKSRVERQRLVNDALREELRDQIHALAMKTLSPAEAAAKE